MKSIVLLLAVIACTPRSARHKAESVPNPERGANAETLTQDPTETVVIDPTGSDEEEDFSIAPPCQRTVVGSINNDSLLEISGIDLSLDDDQRLYVHNDSGDSATLYQIDNKGQFVQSFAINGNAVDWEDLSVGPCEGATCIYIADFGNNDADRDSFQIYRLKEGETEPVVINFSYPDGGAYNAETLAISPKNGDMYVVRKTTEIQNTLYRFPSNPVGDVTLTKVCDFTDIGTERVTGGDLHHSGEKILIRTNENIYEYYAKNMSDGSVCQNRIRALPHSEPQGEAVAYLNKSHSFYSVSEGANQPLYLFTCK